MTETKRKLIVYGGLVVPLAATALSILGVIVLSLTSLFMPISVGEAPGPVLLLPMVLMVAGLVLGLLVHLPVNLWCLYDIATGGRVKPEHRIFWALGWFVFNALVVLAYIALYIWSAPTTDGDGATAAET